MRDHHKAYFRFREIVLPQSEVQYCTAQHCILNSRAVEISCLS